MFWGDRDHALVSPAADRWMTLRGGPHRRHRQRQERRGRRVRSARRDGRGHRRHRARADRGRAARRCPRSEKLFGPDVLDADGRHGPQEDARPACSPTRRQKQRARGAAAPADPRGIGAAHRGARRALRGARRAAARSSRPTTAAASTGCSWSTCPRRLQLERVRARSGLSEDEVRAIMRSAGAARRAARRGRRRDRQSRHA